MDNDGAASGQCRSNFPSGHEEGEVPRNDLANHADGLAQYDGEVFFVQLVGTAFFAADHAGKIAEVVGGQWNVGGAGFADGFAVVERFLQGEEFGMLINHIGNFVQNGGALGGGGFAPGFKRGLCGGYGGIHVGVGGVGEFSQEFAVGGVVRFQQVAGLCPLAVDEQTVFAVENVQIFSHFVGSPKNCAGAGGPLPIT